MKWHVVEPLVARLLVVLLTALAGAIADGALLGGRVSDTAREVVQPAPEAAHKPSELR